MKIGYLGPPGTYSYAAARKFKVEQPDYEEVALDSLEEVVEFAATCTSNYSVLPIENSTNGEVRAALRALITKSQQVKIVGQILVPVKHQLYTNSTSLETITEVLSHPQVWGQTDKWLNKNLPNVLKTDCRSTSEAIKLALTDKSGTLAAIGAPSTTPPFIDNCADDSNNTTRFLILTSDKTSIKNLQSDKYCYTAHNIRLEALANAPPISFISTHPSSKNWEYDVYIESPTQSITTNATWRALGGI